MAEYLIIGLVVGGIYAISAAGIVFTYASSGVLNFAFGAQAYFIARLFYFLHSQHHMGLALSAVLSILVASPLMGLFLWAVVLNQLRHADQLTKIVVTIGLSVALPALADLAFGSIVTSTVPGLAPIPVAIYHVLGVAITADQVIVLGCTLLVAAVGGMVLHRTGIGLVVRAQVDSEALSSVSGVNPRLVSAGVWTVATLLAGLMGVLLAPIVGLTSDGFALLVASSFAAVVAAKLRHLGRAVIAGLALGIANGVVQRYVPVVSAWSSASLNALPFGLILLSLAAYARSGAITTEDLGGALDRTIASTGGSDVPRAAALSRAAVLDSAAARARLSATLRNLPTGTGGLVGIALIALLPLILHGVWLDLFGEGVAFGVAFLSFTIVVGEGGMIWLCQVTFAGIGAVATAQLSTNHGLPLIVALVIAGLIAVPCGVFVGFITIRLGGLYVALVTLAFGVLVDNLVFSLDAFSQDGQGVAVLRPSYASGTESFAYSALVVFCIVGFLVVNLRRSTTGLALTAVRWSPVGARSIGISDLQLRCIAAGLSAFVAAIGGGLLAIYSLDATPVSFDTLGGLAWLAVLVTVGIRSNVAALVAGIAFAMAPGLFVDYLPQSLAQLPTVLFGLGAVLVAKYPEGTLTVHARAVGSFTARLVRQSPAASLTTSAAGGGT